MSEPEALIALFREFDLAVAQVGLEAAMQQACFPVELLETRHLRGAFETMRVKTDRKDGRGIAQDATGPVPAGALQVATVAGDAGAADRAEAAAVEAARHGDELAQGCCAASG